MSNVELANMNNIELASISNVELANMNNVELSSMNNVELSSMNNVEKYVTPTSKHNPHLHGSINGCFDLSGENDYRGGHGPLHVTQGKMENPLFKTFVEASVQAGYSHTTDMNGYQQAGFGPMDLTIHKGRRWNTANAYLKPIMFRENLVALTEAYVRTLIIENNKAVGVEYYDGRTKIKTIRAAKEVGVGVVEKVVTGCKKWVSVGVSKVRLVLGCQK